MKILSPRHVNETLCEAGRVWLASRLWKPPAPLIIASVLKRKHSRPIDYQFVGKPRRQSVQLGGGDKRTRRRRNSVTRCSSSSSAASATINLPHPGGGKKENGFLMMVVEGGRAGGRCRKVLHSAILCVKRKKNVKHLVTFFLAKRYQVRRNTHSQTRHGESVINDFQILRLSFEIDVKDLKKKNRPFSQTRALHGFVVVFFWGGGLKPKEEEGFGDEDLSPHS